MDVTARGGGRNGLESLPVKLEIVDVEKVKGLSNYYAYIIKVLCKDGTHYHIYRRYKQFDEMHNWLEKRFPIEAGAIKVKDRVLPNLPGKKLFGRSAIREVTDRRLPLLNTYLQKLLVLPDKIRYDSIVTSFAKPTSDDQAHPYTGNQAYKMRHTTKPDRPAGPPTRPVKPVDKPARPPPSQRLPSSGPSRPSKPSILPKTSGRAPPTIPPPPRPATANPKGKALYSYTAMHFDEMSFEEGDLLSLLEQVDSGLWWKATLKGKSGLVPANYIEVIGKGVVQDFKDRVQESDEWDSSDEDDRKGSGVGTITYYYNGAARTVEVDQQLVSKPTFIGLYRAIQKQLHQHDITLNYKDSDGDLVQVLEQEDIQLLKTDAIAPRKHSDNTSHAPWAIYVTQSNDNSVYNTAPPR